jgi:hypothetical protein
MTKRETAKKVIEEMLITSVKADGQRQYYDNSDDETIRTAVVDKGTILCSKEPVNGTREDFQFRVFSPHKIEEALDFLEIED